MKAKAIFFALALTASFGVQANEGAELPEAKVNMTDTASLQRGAKLFVNYCLSCHSAKFARYNRTAADLGISEDVLKANLMLAGDKVGEGMTIAMRDDDSKRWFGRTPPDLSVIARSRGADWLYAYLTEFYRDPAKGGKVDNLRLPGLSMPHVLWELQGWQEPVWATDEKGNKHIKALELKVPGKLTKEQYAQTANDLVNFLAYVGEPAQLERKSLGLKVLVYLLLLAGVFYLLKREYWRDVH